MANLSCEMRLERIEPSCSSLKSASALSHTRVVNIATTMIKSNKQARGKETVSADGRSGRRREVSLTKRTYRLARCPRLACPPRTQRVACLAAQSRPAQRNPSCRSLFGAVSNVLCGRLCRGDGVVLRAERRVCVEAMRLCVCL